MKIGEVYKKGKECLDKNSFEVLQLFENCFGLNRQQIIINSNKEADNEKIEKFFQMIKLRKSSYPLQYILGCWEFMGVNLKVTEGVLIPREDTATLVKESIKRLSNKGILKPKILELCSGSGAIAIALAKQLTNSSIVAVELSDKALECLRENVEANNASNVTILKQDIKEAPAGFNCDYDIIISNPPYIKFQDLKTLQKEVQFEPKMALDGGSDGLDFYRLIAKNYLGCLKQGGIISVEVGENQSQDVRGIFKSYGICHLETIFDFNGLERVVSGIKT